MASIFIFKSLVVFSQLLLLVSGSAHYEQCPSSFMCGDLGTIKFPFTVSQHPHCGVLAIHGCHDPNPKANKSIQISNAPTGRFRVRIVENSTITITDLTLGTYLRSKRCDAFSYDLTLPPSSPLGTLYMKYNTSLFRCNKSLNLTLPQHYYNYTSCPAYNIVYYALQDFGVPLHPSYHGPRPFPACSKVQFAIRDSPDTDDPFSFLSHEILMEVQLSDDCTKCVDREGGNCQLDGEGKFQCVPGMHRQFGRNSIPDKNLAWKLGLGIGIPGFIIIGLFLFLCLRKPRCGPDFYSKPQPESGSVYFGIPVFSFKDLEVATKYFDRSRVLGDGGFGTVYYGKLKDGREVAIKRLYEHNYRRMEQFMNEVKILTRLRHINLVSLYGCTSRHSHELLLVYEYISNGTIASHLHHRSTRPGFLPWPIRMKVAIETATALAYLHASDIIHRDVKTNNILLDNSFCVKVADFGMSRLFPNDVTHVSTAPQGTPGYLDPEYHQFYQLTSKSDVYSFGVVLIELVSSMPAVDMTRHRDEISLANLAIRKIKNGAIGELVDPSLGFESDSDVRREIVLVAELAFQCLQRDKEFRPSMEVVLEALMGIGSGKDVAGPLEEVEDADGDVHCPPSPASPDHDEVKLLKSMKPTPSPKAVTEKWDSESTTPTPNVSSQSPSQSNISIRSFCQEKTSGT